MGVKMKKSVVSYCFCLLSSITFLISNAEGAADSLQGYGIVQSEVRNYHQLLNAPPESIQAYQPIDAISDTIVALSGKGGRTKLAPKGTPLNDSQKTVIINAITTIGVDLATRYFKSDGTREDEENTVTMVARTLMQGLEIGKKSEERKTSMEEDVQAGVQAGHNMHIVVLGTIASAGFFGVPDEIASKKLEGLFLGVTPVEQQGAVLTLLRNITSGDYARRVKGEMAKNRENLWASQYTKAGTLYRDNNKMFYNVREGKILSPPRPSVSTLNVSKLERNRVSTDYKGKMQPIANALSSLSEEGRIRIIPTNAETALRWLISASEDLFGIQYRTMMEVQDAAVVFGTELFNIPLPSNFSLFNKHIRHFDRSSTDKTLTFLVSSNFNDNTSGDEESQKVQVSLEPFIKGFMSEIALIGGNQQFKKTGRARTQEIQDIVEPAIWFEWEKTWVRSGRYPNDFREDLIFYFLHGSTSTGLPSEVIENNAFIKKELLFINQYTYGGTGSDLYVKKLGT
jgi:hypothetical protein